MSVSGPAVGSGVTPSSELPPQVAGATWRERLPRMALCVLSGVLWFLGCPDFDLWPLSWIAMVPALFAVDRARTTREAFFYAWIAGAVGNTGGFYWISGLLVRFAFMPWPVAVALLALLGAYQGLIFGAFGALSRVIGRRNGLPMALAAPVCIVACEYATPVIFPFSVGITQAWQRHVIQIADVTGQLGVSFLLLMVNGAIYDLLREGRRRVVSSALAGAFMLAALGYGHYRIGQFEQVRAAAPQVSVGVVQPNVAFDLKGVEHPRVARDQLQDLQLQSALLEHQGADLILWPESGYPYSLSRELATDLSLASPARIRRGFSSTLVFGAITVDERENGARLPYNTALVLNHDGVFSGRFDKIYLMLFGEYTPGRETFPWLARLMPSTAGHFTAGRSVHALPYRDRAGREWKLGPMICFEDIVASFGRKLAVYHPHLLVNLTNDAWFGDTAEPWEHLALSVYRAVEMRTDLVRAVNTGVSSFIDSTGQVFAKTYAVDPALHPRGADRLLGRVALVEGGHTVYAKLGDLFSYGCVAVVLSLWLLLPRIRCYRAKGQTE